MSVLDSSVNISYSLAAVKRLYSAKFKETFAYKKKIIKKDRKSS